MRPTLNRYKLQGLAKHSEVHSVSGIATIMSTELQCALLKLRVNGCSVFGYSTFAFWPEPTGTLNRYTSYNTT